MQIKILIVDDDLTHVTALEKTFTTMLQGYLVLTATTANSGLSMLKEQRPDVVILDVRLGPASGMDLLQDFYGYLESRKIQRKPRFVVITAYPDEAVRRDALEKYKVDAFLTKPFSGSAIIQNVVDSILRVLDDERHALMPYASKQQKNGVA